MYVQVGYPENEARVLLTVEAYEMKFQKLHQRHLVSGHMESCLPSWKMRFHRFSLQLALGLKGQRMQTTGWLKKEVYRPNNTSKGG